MSTYRCNLVSSRLCSLILSILRLAILSLQHREKDLLRTILFRRVSHLYLYTYMYVCIYRAFDTRNDLFTAVDAFRGCGLSGNFYTDTL